jgi:ubiquinone/menaquinone biosynthesis C-methylase UbiE
MLASKFLEQSYKYWNKKWKSPYGRSLKKYVNKRLWFNPIVANFIGPFSFQLNSNTRTFEYPWVVYNGDFKKGMKVLDIGGGYSGLPFVLDAMGMNITNVDPFFQYSSKNEYIEDPEVKYKKLNKAFHANVDLKRCCINEANLDDCSFDRAYSVSAIEHIDEDNIRTIVKEVYRILKPGGLFILTVDLFLNVFPFSKRERNEFGGNVSIKDLLEMEDFSLHYGEKSELYGFDEFDVEQIQGKLENYYMGQYPVLVQTLILRK